MEDNRPDPDRLLKIANEEARTRGRLKIFFAASAGSGKTYAMLSEAIRLMHDGFNVLAGVVEHHGRTETAALAAQIPALPKREIEHRGIVLTEFDLDGALGARPDLVLIDELAHSNAPGSRHPKRWQDVEELLSNGIDVYTTVNVQHLESVNDIVARLTGIWVRETVPDHVFEQADEIALIDIPAEELLKRLSEGKVYIAEGANRQAADSFFKKSNLMALRELALRRTAERVEQQSDDLQHSTGQPDFAVAPKILVVVDHDPLSSRLIRIGRRMATRGKVPFSVLYVVNSLHDEKDETSIARMDQQIRLAEDLGAGVTRLNGLQTHQDILDFAERNGFSRIIVGYRKPHFWQRFFDRPLSQKLVEGSNGIEIIAVNGDEPLKSERSAPVATLWNRVDRDPKRFGYALLIVTICTLIGLPFRGLINPDNLTMVFMTGVVLSAVRLGTAPSILTAVLGIAAFNFFFIEPYYVFTAFDHSYYFTFVLMFLTSLLGGSLTGQLRNRAELARKREVEVGILYDLTRSLSSIQTLDAVASEMDAHIGTPFRVKSILWVKNAGELMAIPPSDGMDLREQSAALWAFENKAISGRGTDTMPSATGVYLPLIANEACVGTIAFYPDDGKRRFSSSEIQQFETFASLLAVAIQRSNQAEDAAKSRVETENEKLRNALLASLSHDLRTPITVMNGGLSALLRMRKKLPREALDEVTSLWTQLNGLQKFVANLLKMAAITSGSLKLKREPYLVQEIIGAALSRVDELKGDRSITTAINGQLPIIELDGGLIEQVMINLLENAIAHTSPDGKVSIFAERDADAIRIRVSDNGPGLEPGTEELIFGQSHLVDGPRPDRRGSESTGLGLVICRAIVQAHGGMIYAKNNPAIAGQNNGSSFIFTLPTNRTSS